MLQSGPAAADGPPDPGSAPPGSGSAPAAGSSPAPVPPQQTVNHLEEVSVKEGDI